MNSRRVLKGQTVVIVALCALALMAFVGLAVDGGSTLLQRRNMQNGADAGALGAAQLMQGNIAATCSPTPCHPTYLITNADVSNTVNQFVTANRGGVIGTPTYSTTIEYHFMTGAPSNGGTYVSASTYSSTLLVPSYVDRVRVTASVQNPTTFAQAIGISTVPVSAQAAAELKPTCRPLPPDGPSLPFTRFRPPMESLLQNVNTGNDLCHPIEFWNSNGDFQSSNFDNLISFNVNSFHPLTGTITQTISLFDYRRWSTDTLGIYNHAAGNPPWTPCITSTGANCADLRGSGQPTGSPATQDAGNWIFWQWNGILSIHSVYPSNTETRYPATRNNNGGQAGSVSTRAGDWAEVYQGSFGQNVQEAVHDLAQNYGVDTPVSPPPSAANPSGLNWGKAIDKVIYLWGPPLQADPTNGFPNPFDSSHSDTRTAQTWCTGNQCNGYTGWEDLRLSWCSPCPPNPNAKYGKDSQFPQGNSSIDRVRFTTALTFRFYENLQGNFGALGAIDPTTGTRCSLSNAGSSAWGLFVDTIAPGPVPPGNCGWQPGGSVYTRVIDPNAP